MIHDDIARVLPELQAHAESMMVDTCTISRRVLDENGEPVRVMDPETLAYEDSWETVYEGKARVQRASTSSDHPASAGDFQYGIEPVELQLPISAAGVRRGDRVTVTSSTFDPDLLGVVATVRVNLTKTHSTKRTLICEEVS